MCGSTRTFPFVHEFKSIPFEVRLDKKGEGQFSAPAMPKKTVNSAEEEVRPLVLLSKIENLVGLEEKTPGRLFFLPRLKIWLP